MQCKNSIEVVCICASVFLPAAVEIQVGWIYRHMPTAPRSPQITEDTSKLTVAHETAVPQRSQSSLNRQYLNGHGVFSLIPQNPASLNLPCQTAY